MSLAARAPLPNWDAIETASIAAITAMGPESINGYFPVRTPDGPDAEHDADRSHEDEQGITASEQRRAIYTSPMFWSIAALLPRNNLENQGPGRPQDYPDWFLLYIVCVAGITDVKNLSKAVGDLRDAQTWPAFVEDIDRFVPEDMTRLGDIEPDPKKWKDRKRARAQARTRLKSNVIPLKPTTPAAGLSTHLIPPPRQHHIDYFILKWRGFQKTAEGKQPLPATHPWKGMRRRIFAEFRRAAAEQAMAMGMVDPAMPFDPSRPHRNQFAGFDGTVLSVMRTRKGSAFDDHEVAGGKYSVWGSKYGIMSARILGQYGSRVILDFAHLGRDPHSLYNDEAVAVLDMLPALKERTRGGCRGLLIDSVLRGEGVTQLERQNLHVVNYPHAVSNPGAKEMGRLNPTRVEKSRLRHIHIHTLPNGRDCKHNIFAIGGEMALVDRRNDGSMGITRLDPRRRETRTNRTGAMRHYFIVDFRCTKGKQDIKGVRVPLFHTDATSNSISTNWGEVVRYYPPTSPQFQYLYRGRNDTESRHADLKQRISYLPSDVLGQDLRLLGAFITINAIAWQFHLQAHRLPNVFDNTA